MQRKWLLIQARRCMYCGLIYRWPTDASGETRAFYERGYEGQQATDIPDPEALKMLVSAGFRGTQYNKSDRIAFLTRRGIKSGKLLDFGCAWGYSTHQYREAGYVASGFEIDRRRADYGRTRMGMTIYSGWGALESGERFDIVIADHSLEHVPRIGETLTEIARHLLPGGRLVLFVPNGACLDARRKGVGWGPYLGESHTMAFTMEWFSRNLPRHGMKPTFFDLAGAPLREGDYLADQSEIALVAAFSE